MFKIIDGNFKTGQFSNEEYLDNWPMLYILENGKQAYIGESTHAKTRMTQHATSEEKRIFDKVHFIYSNMFNQSVTFDYESKLIQYVVADELYTVMNKNAGIADKQYYKKDEYDEKFAVLWRKLQREKLVKHSLEELQNSDLFKYSPFKELNDDQREAVDRIIDAIRKNDSQTIVVNGMPGSGKTIVAIYILKYLKDTEEFKDKTVGFVVPQISLRKTIKKIFKSIYNLSPKDVLGPSEVAEKKYDILLVEISNLITQGIAKSAEISAVDKDVDKEITSPSYKISIASRILLAVQTAFSVLVFIVLQEQKDVSGEHAMGAAFVIIIMILVRIVISLPTVVLSIVGIVKGKQNINKELKYNQTGFKWNIACLVISELQVFLVW